MQNDVFLGIDYGEARVGTARSYGTLAEPLEVLPNTSDLMDQLANLSKKHDISRLVVGISEQEMAEKSRVFGEQLSKHLNLPVSFVDETLSSREVQRKLRQAYQGKQKPKGPIDHFAASLILQEFLDDLEA